MPQSPHDRRIAPHVQAAMAIIQPMARGLSPARVPPAAHLQAAVERSRQPPPPSAPAKAGPVPAPRAQGPAAQTKMPPGPPRAGSSGVVQRASKGKLKGKYAQVGDKLKDYSIHFYNEWEAQLLEGQALLRPAPNIGVHAGQPGGDNSSAPARIEKARKALNKWYASLQQSRTDRGLDNIELVAEDEYRGPSSSQSYQSVDVDRDALKKEKKRARQLEWENERTERPPYIAPWKGGPSPWPY